MTDLIAPGTRLLLTAEEAYPAFEEAVLDARSEVIASFRVFDPETQLRSARALELGDTWADLIAVRLADGVRFDLTLTDFDPVARPEMHRTSWRAHSGFIAAGAKSGRPELMSVRVDMHPARVGWLQRLALWPVSRREVAKECDRLNALSDDQRTEALRDMPGFAKMVLQKGGVLHPRLWPPAPLVPATHHQKLAVLDGARLYIGGLDIDDRRYDTLRHDRVAEETWYDVQVLVEDTALAESARQHLLRFRKEARGSTPQSAPGLLRTLSQQRSSVTHLGPRECVTELEERHLAMIEAAEGLIYLETQFLRSTRIAEALAEAARRNTDLNLITLLPAAPSDVAFDGNRQIDARYGEMLQADAIELLRDAYGDRFFAGAPARPSRGEGKRDVLCNAEIIYIHAKLSVFGGQGVIVSSANLNGRSMRWDTEAGLAFQAASVAPTLARCRAHWRPDLGPGTGGWTAAAWADAAARNAERAPEERPHFILPYAVTPAREIASPAPGMPEEMV